MDSGPTSFLWSRNLSLATCTALVVLGTAAGLVGGGRRTSQSASAALPIRQETPLARTVTRPASIPTSVAEVSGRDDQRSSPVPRLKR